ncbi:hypothetical protein ACVWZW_004711 [Bradyrhizobium sp. F1.13.4]
MLSLVRKYHGSGLPGRTSPKRVHPRFRECSRESPAPLWEDDAPITAKSRSLSTRSLHSQKAAGGHVGLPNDPPFAARDLCVPSQHPSAGRSTQNLHICCNRNIMPLVDAISSHAWATDGSASDPFGFSLTEFGLTQASRMACPNSSGAAKQACPRKTTLASGVRRMWTTLLDIVALFRTVLR